MRTKFKNVANLLFIVLFASCSREGIVENGETDNGKIAVATEVSVDGVELTTRAASEAGYTTGDGLYDKDDDVVVAAFANDGYELAAFYDKEAPSINLGSSYRLTVSIPRTFKAEFRKKGFTVTVNASPTDGGTVTGGGSYNKGATCTLTAIPNNGYTFDGWYEGSTKVSTSSSYNFTVSSNRTITAKFGGNISITAVNNDNTLYLTASVPVKTAITTICQITLEEWRQDYPDGESGLVHTETLTVTFTIQVGAMESNKEHFEIGGYPGNDHQYYIDSQNHSTWNNKTINGITYQLNKGWEYPLGQP